MNQQKIFNLLSIILILYFIIAKINLIMGKKSEFIKTLTEFTTYAHILCCIALFYPNNEFLVNLTLCSIFAASLGYWCVIYQLEGCNKNGYFRAILTHFINIIIAFAALFSGYFSIGTWSIIPYICFCVLLILVLILQIITKKYINEPVYGHKAGNLTNNKTYINLILIFTSTYIFYRFLHL